MNKLSALEKNTKIHIMKTNKISHHRKARTNKKHKGSPQKQIKKKTPTKNAFLSLLLFNLKKHTPEQFLTAIAVRVLIVEFQSPFLTISFDINRESAISRLFIVHLQY